MRGTGRRAIRGLIVKVSAGALLFSMLMSCRAPATRHTVFGQKSVTLSGIVARLSQPPPPLDSQDDPRGVNPILVVWSLMKEHFEPGGLNTVLTEQTPDGRLSYVLYSETWRPYLAGSVMEYLQKGPPPSMGPACGYDFQQAFATFQCCLGDGTHERFTIDCVQKLRWDGALNEIGVRVMKCSFGYGVLRMIAAEVARKSFFITKAEIVAKRIPSNSLVFLWNADTGQPDRYLMTVVDDVLVEHLAYLLNTVMPKFRDWLSVQPVENVYYRCFPGSIVRDTEGIVGCGTLYAPLFISRGETNAVLRPTDVAPYESSVNFVGELPSPAPGCIVLNAARMAPAVGGSNRALVEAFELYRALNSKPFECFGIGLSDTLLRGANIVNNREASVFTFYSMILWALGTEVRSMNVIGAINQTCPREIQDRLGARF